MEFGIWCRAIKNNYKRFGGVYDIKELINQNHFDTLIIKAFREIVLLESFLVQTSPLIGTTYHHNFLNIIKVNATLPINHAIKHLLNYKDQILNKDENYFIAENNYIEDSNDNILSEIIRLKDIYYKLNNDSKENVWSILKALLQLTIEYKELKNL